MNRMNRMSIAASVAALSLLAACASEPEQPVEQPPVASTAASSTSRAAAPSAAPGVAPRNVASGRSTNASSADLLAKRSVFYDYDDSAVKPEFRPVIAAHGAYLKAHPAAKVELEGNCDERGSREYNLALGQKRADALKKMLVLTGASDSQIETVSYGEEHPRAQGHDESSWAQNRRTDLDYKRMQ